MEKTWYLTDLFYFVIVVDFENTDVGLDVEFRHVRQWAESNRLTLNTAKTKEIVFRRPRVKFSHAACC